jgi:hypothetical protein
MRILPMTTNKEINKHGKLEYSINYWLMMVKLTNKVIPINI